ncbi:MAG: hypothetical protein ACFCU5_03230 [Pleurocapsa sp.]
MKKLSASILLLSIITIAFKSEAKTKYLFDKHFSSVPFDGQVTENSHKNFEHFQSDQPPTLTQVGGLQESEIQGIYLHLEYGYSNGVTIEYNPYLLLKDGSIYKNLPASLTDLDVTRSKQTEAENWGTWQINGKTLSIQWNNGEQDSWNDNWFQAFPAEQGDSLNGNYKSLTLGGNTSLGGDIMTAAFNNISFSPDGRFSQEKGAGAFSDSVATNSQDSTSGTYQLDNYTIEFRYQDGRVVRKMFYFYPHENGKTDKTIGIGNSSFIKRKS